MKTSLILLLLFLASCSEKTDNETENQAAQEQAWDSSFFAPKLGEKLLYRETIESVSMQQTKPVSPENINKVEIDRVQVYNGPEMLEGKKFHRYSIYNDGKFQEGFLFHWTGELLLVAGSFAEDQKPVFAQPPIPIAHIEMTTGSYWHWPEYEVFGNGSRVIGFEPVKVPAGTIDAYKVSIKKTSIGKVTLREYWFAPKIGIIKEKNHIYYGGILRAINTIEFVGRADSDDEAKSS